LSEAGQVLLLIGVSLLYLCLLFVPPATLRTIGRPLKRILPRALYAWLVRELVLGNATARFGLLQDRMRRRISELASKQKVAE
jgi:hypothetical protein